MGKHIQFALAGAGLGLAIGVTILGGRASLPTQGSPRVAQIESNSGNSPTPVVARAEEITSAVIPKDNSHAGKRAVPDVDSLGRRVSEELDGLLREALKAEASDFPDLWSRWLAVSETSHAFKKASVGSSIAGRWMFADPKGAMAFVDSLPAGESSDQLRHGFANAWFKDEPARAIEWVSRWPSSQRKDELLRRFAPTWTVVDREAAYAFALSLSDAKVRANLITTFASFWTPGSRAEASEWINIWPEENRQLAVVHATRLLARQNSAEAIKLAKEYPDTSCMDAVISEWAENNPSAVAQWLETQPAAERPANAVVRIAEQWSHFDLEATGEWLARVEPGEARDRAMGIYAARLAQSDRSAARGWAEQIADEKLREEALRIVTRGSEPSSDGVQDRR